MIFCYVFKALNEWYEAPCEPTYCRCQLTMSLWQGFDNDYFSGASCSDMFQTLGFKKGCTIGDDCSTITYKMNFVEKPIIRGTQRQFSEEYPFGRQFEIYNFRNICCKISCLPASHRIFEHVKRSPRIFGSLFSGWNFRESKFWSLLFSDHYY